MPAAPKLYKVASHHVLVSILTSKVSQPQGILTSKVSQPTQLQQQFLSWTPKSPQQHIQHTQCIQLYLVDSKDHRHIVIGLMQ